MLLYELLLRFLLSGRNNDGDERRWWNLWLWVFQVQAAASDERVRIEEELEPSQHTYASILSTCVVIKGLQHSELLQWPGFQHLFIQVHRNHVCQCIIITLTLCVYSSLEWKK